MPPLVFVASFFALLLAAVSLASPVDHKVTKTERKYRQKRAGPRLIEECLLVTVEEATYFYKSSGSPEVCGLYVVSEPDQRIEITVDYLQVDCDTGGIVTLLDGWEMAGEVFPPLVEENTESRVTNLCGQVRKRLFITSSNAATILYKTPNVEDTFKITVNFLRHPKPCNILLTSEAEIVTLRNHGLRRNCTLATAFPASIKVVEASVGAQKRISSKLPQIGVERGLMTRCHKRGYDDMVKVGGSAGLDTRHMQIGETFCGFDSNPKVPWLHILCDVSGVTLVSSGRFDNSVTVAVTPLTELDQIPTTVCDIAV